MKNKHRGSNFDDFLKEEELLEEVETTAMKKVIAWQLKQKMKKISYKNSTSKQNEK